MLIASRWYESQPGCRLWQAERRLLSERLGRVTGGTAFEISGAPASQALITQSPCVRRYHVQLQRGQSGSSACLNGAFLSETANGVPLQDECLDLLVMRHGYVAGAENLLEAGVRALKPGGMLFVTCINQFSLLGLREVQDLPRINPFALVAAARRLGLVSNYETAGFRPLKLGAIRPLGANNPLKLIAGLRCFGFRKKQQGSVVHLGYSLRERMSQGATSSNPAMLRKAS